ncbi:MAG: hypothetical protein A4E26_01176 [Methanobacterium sp. PtaU1.Bin097]|nr:MAG: hypothetical protein A4E26_01176 [Methanobacterium sp. PtaU1.Bin097]
MKDYHEFTGTKSIIFEIVGKERFKVEEDLDVEIVDTYNENENVVTFWKDDIPEGIDIYDYAEKVCKAMNEDV